MYTLYNWHAHDGGGAVGVGGKKSGRVEEQVVEYQMYIYAYIYIYIIFCL